VPPRSDIAIRPARRPLRFTWQMDADGHFLLGSDEFTRLIGLRTATAFGRPWRTIADAFDLDPEGLVAKAVATRDTWSGITLHWPVDGPGLRLPVELSGLPVYDREQTFVGYRGFGVCRDLDALGRLAAQRHYDLSSEQPSPRPLAADVPHGHDTDHAPSHQAGDSSPPSPPTQSDHPLETPILDTPQNVVHLRPNSDLKSPALTPVENSAFNELARQLSERLELDHADVVEHERHCAGLGEVAAALGEGGAHVAGGAVSIVSQRLDDHRDPTGAVALVAHVLVALGLASLRFLDSALDVVLRHVLGTSGDDRGPQPRVHRGIGHAELGSGGDFAGEL